MDMLACRAAVLEWMGDLAPSLELSESAVEGSRVNDNPTALVWALGARCTALAACGEYGGRRGRGARRRSRVATAIKAPALQISSLWLLGEALVAHQEHARAAALLLERLGGDELTFLYPSLKPLVFDTLTRCAIATGGDGEVWAERARAAAVLVDLPLPRAVALLSGAEVRVARGESALAEAEEAFGLLDRAAAGLEAGRARLLMGRSLINAGEHEAAGGVLRAVEADAAARGAELLRASAARELRRIGRRVRVRDRAPSTAGGLPELSDREREVADLVAARHTNREIAARLFLSEKTVESHLANIFRKLGVRTRREVARVVESAG